MTNEKFIYEAKELVRDYIADTINKAETVPEFETYVVWNCYILGYQKALISTTLPDKMYYEVTYNAEKNEIYLDAYVKIHNRAIKM